MARKKKDPEVQAPTLPTAFPELTQELAAVSLAILDKEDERKTYTTEINGEIKRLKKRQRDIASEIKSGGRQLRMMFDPNTAGETPLEH